MGGGKKGGSSSGWSGKVKFPPHIFGDTTYSGFVRRWLRDGTSTFSSSDRNSKYDGSDAGAGKRYDVDEDILTAADNNPFATAIKYDPASRLGYLMSNCSSFEDYISKIEEDIDWLSLSDHISDIYDTIEVGELSSSYTNRLVDISNKTRDTDRGILSFMSSGTLARSGDVASAASSLYDELTSDSHDAAENGTSRSMHKLRVSLLGSLASELTTKILKNADLYRTSYDLANKVGKMDLAVYKEELDRNLLTQEDAVLWDLSLWQYGSSIATALQGGSGAVRDDDLALGAGSVLRGEIGAGPTMFGRGR